MELTKNISQTKLIKTVLAIILGSIALTISAKIKIPFYPVPMTMQTFVVLFLGVSPWIQNRTCKYRFIFV
jgi:biotin transport system substrate-specific component